MTVPLKTGASGARKPVHSRGGGTGRDSTTRPPVKTSTSTTTTVDAGGESVSDSSVVVTVALSDEWSLEREVLLHRIRELEEMDIKSRSR